MSCINNLHFTAGSVVLQNVITGQYKSLNSKTMKNNNATTVTINLTVQAQKRRVLSVSNASLTTDNNVYVK